MVGRQGKYTGLTAMLLLLASWILTFALATAIGRSVGQLISIPSGSSTPTVQFDNTRYFLVGLSVIAFIGNIWSLFLPINGSLILALGVLALPGIYRWIIRSKKFSLYTFLLLCLLTISALSLSLTLTTNIDEAGYYLPLVKWLESYPVVPGTALINHRVGFNSTYHMLCAIFGLEWITEGGVYKLNGLLFIVFNLYFFKQLKDLVSSDGINFSKLLSGAALIFPYSFLIDSMDPDYLSITGSLIVIAWTIEMNKRKTNATEISLLFLVCFFLFTVRPFNAFLLVMPGIAILTNSECRKLIPTIIVLGIIYLFPWFLRNYYCSGYLIFPIHFVDVFDPIWKVPKHVAQASYEIIKEFAKLEIVRPEYLYESMTHPTFSDWWPVWFPRTWKMLIGKFVICFVPVSVLIVFLSRFIKSKSLTPFQFCFLLLAMGVSVIWFINYPSIRFVWPWLLLLVTGAGFVLMSYDKMKKVGSYALVALVIFSWARLLFKLDYTLLSTHPLQPISTNVQPAHTVKMLGQIPLKYASDPHCHGLTPPCAPYNNELEIIPLGNKVEDGFRIK